MATPTRPIIIATRGSALALAQAHFVLGQCREAFPQLEFQLRIIKTTGDKLATASLANPSTDLPKGLFTKELEVALLEGSADLAVHSLKDLPTELPAGLKLGAVGERADVRDVLLFRNKTPGRRTPPSSPADSPAQPQPPLRSCQPGTTVQTLPEGWTVATSSTRRQAQLLAFRPDLKVVPVRGNVITRLQKLATREDLDALLLAAAGLARLHFAVGADGQLSGDGVPEGIGASYLAPELMLPCVGQAALGIEVRAHADHGALSPRSREDAGPEHAAVQHERTIDLLCQRLDHPLTRQCVTAERAFLRAMGGGCQSPVAAYAQGQGNQLHMRAVSFHHTPARRAEIRGDLRDAAALGETLARQLL